MKRNLLLPVLLLSWLCALCFAPAALGADEPIVNSSDELPPLGGPGWYSALGQSVSYCVEYGTNQGLPPENGFTGIYLEAHDMIVDNFQNVTQSYTNNDQYIRFNAQLTASVTTLSGFVQTKPIIVTLPGSMEVKLVNRLGHPTGTFPLTVEALSFVLTLADMGWGDATPFIGIRISPANASTGQLTVKDIGDGRYEVTSTLSIYSEVAAYYVSGGYWLPHWPDTHAPTTYVLRTLKGPALSSFTISGVAKDVKLEFPMRRYVRYVLEHSPDLTRWTPLKTNDWMDVNDVFRFTHSAGGDAPKGFYLIRSTLQPAL